MENLLCLFLESTEVHIKRCSIFLYQILLFSLIILFTINKL